MAIVRLIAAALLACLLSSCMPRRERVAEPAEGPVLKVTAELPQDSVPIEKPFTLRVRIENISPAPQAVSEWNCSREKNWQTDNLRIKVPSRDCWRNFVETVTLQPGAMHEESVELEALSNRSAETFRVGFTTADGTRVYWSEPVLIRLRPTP